MLTTTQIPEKLYQKAEEFKTAVQQGQHARARYLYYTAIKVAIFVELDEEAKKKLFGQGGAYPPELAKKAWEEKGHAKRRTD